MFESMATADSTMTMDSNDDNGLKNDDKLGGCVRLDCGDDQQQQVKQGRSDVGWLRRCPATTASGALAGQTTTVLGQTTIALGQTPSAPLPSLPDTRLKPGSSPDALMSGSELVKTWERLSLCIGPGRVVHAEEETKQTGPRFTSPYAGEKH
ncbi:hypothetical protein Drorol1_Dr00001670 [Drosera rotundifolia]